MYEDMMCNPATKPQKEPEVLCALGKLDKEIASLSETIDVLYGRLCPVMREAEDKPCGIEGFAMSAPLAQDLASSAGRVARIREKLQDMIERCEV